MAAPFTPKRVHVPGLLSDEGLSEGIAALKGQMQQTDANSRAMQGVDIGQQIIDLDMQMPSPSAPRQSADGAPSTISLSGTPAIETAPEPTPGFGMLTPEQAAEEQRQRQQQADEAVAAVKKEIELSEQFRNLTDEQREAKREAMGIPADPLGLVTTETMARLAAQDEAYLQQAQEWADYVREAPPPTMTWWLDAMQVGARAAAQTATSALKYPFSAYEAAVWGATGLEVKAPPREWLNLVDEQLNAVLPGDPARAKDFVSELAAGAGSFIPFLLAGYIGSALGLPAGVTAGGLGAAATGSQLYEEADSFNAPMLQKALALILGSGVGVTEAIPIDRMFMRVDAGTGGLLRRMFANSAASTLEEFIQEFSQAIGEDMVAKYGAGYDPERELDPMSWLRQGAIGGIIGGVAGAGTTLLPAPGPSAQSRVDVVGQVFDREQERFDQIVREVETVDEAPAPERFVINDPAVGDFEAGPGHGEYVTRAADQTGAPEGMVLVDLPDGSQRAIGENLLEPAGVPFVFTQAMRDRLTTLGETPEAIRNMTPAQAWERINRADTEAAAVAEPVAAPQRDGVQKVVVAASRLNVEQAASRAAIEATDEQRLADRRAVLDRADNIAAWNEINRVIDERTAPQRRAMEEARQAFAEAQEARGRTVEDATAEDRDTPEYQAYVAADDALAEALGAAAEEATRPPETLGDVENMPEDDVGLFSSLLLEAERGEDNAYWLTLSPDEVARLRGYGVEVAGAGSRVSVPAHQGEEILLRRDAINAAARERTRPETVDAQRAAVGLPTRAAIEAVQLSATDTAALPNIEKGLTGPIPMVVKAARAYAAAVGIPHRRQREYVRVDTARAARIAQAYTDMPHEPNDPAVRAAYQAMADETVAQYQFVKATGLKIEAIAPDQADPYPNGPRDVLKDIANGHIWYFPTDQGFGSSDFDAAGNPLLGPTGEVSDNGVPMVVNDLFRVVHDFFGHGLEGAGFGARGEENAWQAHMRLYSASAVPAMTSETRGQNSWVNYGPFGEQNRADPRNTVYADQKTGLMPSWTWTEGVADSMANVWAAPVEIADAEQFHAALMAAKEASRFGGAVHAYTPQEYAKMRLFLSDDGLAGFALNGEDIVSVFSRGGGRPRSLIDTAIAAGGRTLDAFDTGTAERPGLVQMYGALGFVETGRVPFDPAQAPAEWPSELGKPDVVFMALQTDADVERMETSAITSARKPSEIGKGYGDYITYTDPATGGILRVVERIGAARDVSVIDFVVPEEHRGKGAGRALMEKVLTEHPSLMGQVSSKIAAKLAYDMGRRPYNNPDATLDEVYAILDADSSVNLLTPENVSGRYPDIERMATGTSSTRQPFSMEPTRPARGVPEQPSNPPQEGDDVRLTQISANLRKLLKLTVRHGRLTGGKDVMGEYNRKTGNIRLRTWSDLSTLVHEAGHAINDDMSQALDAFVQRNEAEIMRLGVALYAGDLSNAPAKTRRREGFAEFFRVYTLTPDYARNKWANLTADFESTLRAADPQVLEGLNAIAEQFKAWLHLPSSKLIRNMVVDGRRDQGINAAIKELKDVGFKSWFGEYTRRAVEHSVNRYAPLNRLVTDLLNEAEASTGQVLDVKRAEDPRTLVRLARNSGSRAMVEVVDGVYGYRSTQPMSRGLRDAILLSQGVDPNTTPGSLDETRLTDFSAYIVALRARDEYRRMDEGKIDRPPIAASRGDVTRAIRDYEAQYGKSFTDAAAIVHEYGMALWQKQYDAGLMSKETYLDGLDRQFYAPLQRDMSDKKENFGPSALTAGQRSLVRQFHGSDRDIVDPIAILMQKTFALEQLINENEVIKALAVLSDRAGRAGALVERIPASQAIGMTMSVEDAARQLAKDDSLSPADAQDLMTILGASIQNGGTIQLFRRDQVSTKGENILFFWENGKPAAIQLKDGALGVDVVNTLQGIGRENMPLFVPLVTGVSTAFRSAITSWPDFLVVNYIRDQVSAWVLTDVGFTPFASGFKGMVDEVRQKQWAKSYNAAQGIMGGMNVAALHEARVEQDIRSLRSKGYIAQAFSDKTPLLGAVRGFARVTALSETGTRLGLYRKAFERAKAEGLNDYEASVEAAYTATDYIDFGLNGSRMTLFRRTIPFLNAQLQGLYKMMRTLGADEVRQRKGLKFVLGAYFKNSRNLPLSRVEQQALNTGRKAWVKMASLGLLSALLHFLFRDDPDYQDASEYLRTTGWVIPMGDGRIFYIPKPFELALVANAVERGLEFASGDAEAPNRFLRGAAMSLAPPTVPTALGVATDLSFNRDSFTGRDIVPTYMQALEPQLQYDNYTTSFAKWLGSVTNMSPLQIDHVLSGLGASAYRDISGALNAADPTRPSLNETDAPLLRRFIRDARRGATSAQDFWDQASQTTGRLEWTYQTYKRLVEYGNEPGANSYLASLTADEQAYARLMTHFKADQKRLNPFYRARQVSTLISGMRREIASELGLGDTTLKDFPDTFDLTARQKRDVDEVLSELARREVRNTLIATGQAGWQNKDILPLEPTLDLLYEVNPLVYEEYMRRYRQRKIYNAELVYEFWPEVRDRLNMDGEFAILGDVQALAGVVF